MAGSTESSDDTDAKLAAHAAQDNAGVSPPPAGADWRPLGSELGPRLIQQTNNQLRDLAWFRTDWQRGGALTGYANWHPPDDDPQPVVVKLPVPPRERLWLKRLQPAHNVAPRLLADGETVGGYDLAWVVMERLPHGPLGKAWNGTEFDLVIEAAARFFRATAEFDTPTPEPDPDWNKLLDRARKKVRDGAIPEKPRWKTTLKAARKKIDAWAETWAARSREHWCHGDLHLGNAMTRNPPPDGPAILFDYARVQVGHWLRDAIYFEHLYWAAPDALGGRKLCKLLARELREHDVEVGAEWAEWAQAYRLLTAMMVPLRLEEEGAPSYVLAALELLESHV
ncbi:phosphotransferase family protein [Mucisphaera calidilacus]|uniref:Phosphotransferase enzyme family protein n=1 Tax=Mucisphaera calidilacus TaxID=2527982 RepID=A0A518BZ80_9BACT|nr:phosphotransferase [Mucisphaera calidilacus]QDU72265.1 Phosphotransferase enzyme family protein [Mucisphaera calidilacus]